MTKVGIGGAALLAAAALTACVPRSAPPAPAPAPPPRPEPRPAPPQPVPAPTPPPADWQDAPLSAGDWSYRQDGDSALASFRSERLSLTLRCERLGTIRIGLTGAQAPALVVRTSYAYRRLPAAAGDGTGTIATLAASDPLFDQMAFSRGRFLVQADGGPALIVPAWPEVARVTEDCRGQ